MSSPLLRSPLTVSLFVFAVLAVGLGSTNSARAQAASDSDRAAARELATQGIQFQQAGNFTDALDRFDRAQAVFSAPTHLLHIAECETALGKLVEAAETYRTLVRTPLPTGAPNAFVQAQEQGAAELSQVEPRIPAIRVLIRPRIPANTTVQIDGQTMSPALVGMQRPTNPGTHAVVLLAPGYARAEQQIVLKEKETKDVAFNLGGTPGGAAPGGYYPPTPASQSGTPTPNAAAPLLPPAYPSSPPQPLRPRAPEPQGAAGGFMLGASAGGLIPAGNLYQNAAIGADAKGGGALGVVAGFRFVRRLYLGLTFEHGFLSAGTATLPGNVTASADTNYIGLDFDAFSNPDGIGFYGKIGVGYRALELGIKDATGVNTASETYQGAEFSLGIGIHFKIGDWVRLVPNASLSAGQFASSSCSGAASSCGSIANGDTHLFIFLGATGYIDFAKKH